MKYYLHNSQIKYLEYIERSISITHISLRLKNDFNFNYDLILQYHALIFSVLDYGYYTEEQRQELNSLLYVYYPIKAIENKGI